MNVEIVKHSFDWKIRSKNVEEMNETLCNTAYDLHWLIKLNRETLQ